MGVLMCLSLFTLAAFVFAYIVYKEIPEQQKVKLGHHKGLLNSAIKYHVCNHTYCKAAARQYSRHAKLPLNMCEQLTQSLCSRNIISQTKKNSSLSPPSMQKGRLFLDDLNIDAMLKENYFPIDQLREFLHMCVKATKNSGINDFVAIMRKFGLEQWPTTPRRTNLTNLLAAVSTELGYHPLVTITLIREMTPSKQKLLICIDKPRLLLQKLGPKTDTTVAARLLFALTKYLKDYCEHFGLCLQRSEAEHIVTTIIKFEQLLDFIEWVSLLATVLGKHLNVTAETEIVVRSPHYFAGLKEVLEKSSERQKQDTSLWSAFCKTRLTWMQIVNATQDIIEVLLHYTKLTPWFKREDGALVRQRLQSMEINALVPDVAKIRRFVQEYYNNIPIYDKEIGFLSNLYHMQKFMTQRFWDRSIDSNAEAYKWPISSLRKRCALDMQDNRLYIPAIHILLIQESTKKIEFPQVPVLAYYILNALLPMFFQDGSVFDETGSYNEWWTIENEESFFRAERCLLQQYSKSVNSDLQQDEMRSLAAQIMSQNFLVSPSYEAYKRSLKKSGFNLSNFSLYESYPADVKQVFYLAHMTAVCDETETAQNSHLYQMFNEDLSDLYRVNIPFYNFPEYEKAVASCSEPEASVLAKIQYCWIWNPY
uniref:Putative m13 family peptidase n=1 Tax=Ixodes ricinus TaxID=34613 RepID=V5H8L5_IXORI